MIGRNLGSIWNDMADTVPDSEIMVINECPQSESEGVRRLDSATYDDELEIVKVDDGVAGGHGEDPGSGENDVQSVPAKRKRHRRGKSKKRKWKPYNKLTWDEKRKVDDREAQRAQRVRDEMFFNGQPVAPYNTTQFLMDDHNEIGEPDLDHLHIGQRQHRDSSCTENLDSDDNFYSSPEDEEQFMQKEFTEAYDNIHAERLSSMTKSELIQEFLILEDRVDKLEQKLRQQNSRKNNNQLPSPVEGGVDAGGGVTTNETDQEQILEKLRIFQEEIGKLQIENGRLEDENRRLRPS